MELARQNNAALTEDLSGKKKENWERIKAMVFSKRR